MSKKWSKLTGSAVGGASGHSSSHKRWKASQRERRPFVGQANWRHLADGPRGNSSGEDRGQTRARVFEATHSTRVHASSISHGTEKTRVSLLESRRYNTERIEVHYPLFRPPPPHHPTPPPPKKKPHKKTHTHNNNNISSHGQACMWNQLKD